MSKREQLDSLYKEYMRLFANEQIVLGDGNENCRLLLIGEAPGKDEVRLSKPFVGMAGKNLNEFLDVLGLQRQDIYITNAIKYRLSKVNPKTGRIINRPASKDEIIQNRDILLREIGIINPEVIVTLGNVPLKAVTGDWNISIGEVHGNINHVKIDDREYKLYPLYHPASIIYNRSLKETYSQDLMKLKKYIG